MAEQVGEGFIEVDVRIDDRAFVRQSALIAERAANQFGENYSKNVAKAIRVSDQQFSTHINKQISSFQHLERQRVAAAEDTARRLQTIQNRIAQQTVNDRRISDAYEKEGQRAASNFEKEQMASFNRIANAYRTGLEKMGEDEVNVTRRTLARREVDYDNHGRRGGSIIAHHLQMGFEGAMSLLPSRLEFLFTRTGPIIGGTLMVGIAAGAMVAIPALGAMIGAALTGAIGLGAAVAAAFVGAADDPRVAAAADRLVQTWRDRIIMSPETQGIGQALADQLDKVNAALMRWAPSINSILNAGARFLTPITDGLIGMVDQVLPALDRFVNSPFMTVMMDLMSQGMVKIGEAFGTSFDKILANPKAMEGMKLAMEDIFNLAAGAVKFAFDIVIMLSEAWAELNKDPDGPGPDVSTLQVMRDTWKDIRDIISEINSLGQEFNNLFGGGGGGGGPNGSSGFSGEMREASEQIDAIRQAIEKGKGIWKQFREDWNSEMGVLRDNWNSFTQGVAQRWSDAWNSVVNVGKTIWAGIQMGAAVFVAGLMAVWNAVSSGIMAVWNVIRSVLGAIGDFFVAAWHRMYAAFKPIWDGFYAVVTTIGGLIYGFIRAFLEIIWAVWSRIWGVTSTFFAQVWNAIWGVLQVVIGFIWNLIVTALNFLQNLWNITWGAIKDFFIGIWNAIWNFLSTIIGFIWNVIKTFLDILQTTWNTVWQWVSDFVTGIWNAIVSFIVSVTTSIWTTISGWLDSVSKKWGDIWQGILTFFGGIWESIQQGVKDGINFVIRIINKGVDIINKALEGLGVSFRITPLAELGGTVTPQPVAGNRAVMKAQGGYIRGPGTSTSDSIPARLSNGEFVINAKATRKHFGLLSAINSGRSIRPGFVDGGYVQMFNWIKQRIPGVSLASGFRAGDPGYHGKGMAVDLIFSDGSERRGGGMAGAAFNLIKGSFMPVIRELIWDFAGAQAVWNGKNHFFTGSGAGPGTHDDHIHWAQGGAEGGGLLDGLFKWLGKGWNAVITEVFEPMKKSVFDLLPESNSLMAMGKGWVGKTIDQIIAKAKVEFDDAQKQMDTMMASTGDQSGNGMAGALRWSGVATQALQMLGLPLSWLGPLLTLIGRESGGNPNAVNRWDSNAAKGTPSQGLMQTIPPTFNAHKLPGYNNILAPLDNILAGLRYIVSKYGTIFNVQQANSRMSPAGYANGGVFRPGQLGVNETRKPEAILNGFQWEALANSGGTTVKVYIDGVEVAHRAVVEENNKQLSQALRRGRSVF